MSIVVMLEMASLMIVEESTIILDNSLMAWLLFNEEKI